MHRKLTLVRYKHCNGLLKTNEFFYDFKLLTFSVQLPATNNSRLFKNTEFVKNSTVIPRLTNFSANEDFFSWFFALG